MYLFQQQVGVLSSFRSFDFFAYNSESNELVVEDDILDEI